MALLRIVLLGLLLWQLPPANSAEPVVAARPASAAPAAAGAATAAASASYQPRIKPYVDDYGSVVFVLALVGAGALLVVEWRRKPLTLEPFEVPKEFADAGLTGAVVSRQLADAIRELQRNARPDDGPADMSFVELPSMQVDLQLPGMAWSVRGVVRYLKQLVGKTENRVLGEVVKLGKNYFVRLRNAEGQAIQVAQSFRNPWDIPDTYPATAQAAISLINPLEAVSILYASETPATGYPKTLAALRAHLATAPAATHQDAYVLWASVCRALGNPQEMEHKLALARTAARRRWMRSATSTRYLNFVGSIDRERRRFAEAKQAFRAAHRIDRRNIGAMSNLGLLHLDMECPEKAVVWFRRLANKHPTSSRGYRGLGLAAVRTGDHAEGIRQLSRAIDVTPLTRWSRINLIDAYREVGDFAAAEREAAALEAIDSGFAPLHRFRSSLARDLGDPGAARQHAARAIALDPFDPWNHVEAGRVENLLGEFDKAIDFCRAALRLRPQMPEAMRCWAAALAHKGRVDEALVKFREGAEGAPTDVWCLLEMSDLLRTLGRYPEAWSAAQQAGERNPGSHFVRRRCAFVLRDTDDFAGEERELLEAVRLRPNDPGNWIDLSNLRRRERRYEEAEPFARRAAQSFARPSRSFYAWSRVLLDQGRPDEAIAKLREGVAAQPSDPAPWLDLADALLAQNRIVDAANATREALARRPHHAPAWRRWAWVLRDSADHDGAKQQLDAARELAPWDVDGWIESADFCRAIGRTQEALALADEAIRRWPRSSAAHSCKARLLGDGGRVQQAVEAFDRAIEAAPGDLWVRHRLGEALRRWGHWHEAAAVASSVLARRPGNVDAMQRLGWALWDQRRWAESEAQFAAASKARPGDINIRCDQAQMLITQYRAEPALQLLEQAHQLDPRHGAVYRVWARALSALNRQGDAAAKLKEATEVRPDDLSSWIDRVELLQRMERTAEAHAVIAEAIARHPWSAPLRRRHAALLRNASDAAGARAVFDEAAAIAPFDLDVALDTVQLCRTQGALTEAAELALQATLRWPGSARAHNALAWIRHDQGDADAADAAWQRMAELEPGRADTVLDRCDALRASHRGAEAIIEARGVLHLHPRLLRAWRCVARVVEDDGDLKNAEAIWREATEACPDDADAWIELAEVLLKRKDWPAFDHALGTALGLNPVSLWAMRLAAKAQEARPDATEASVLAAWQRIVDAAPSEIDALLHLSRLHAERGEVPQAIEKLDLALDRRPNSPNALRARLRLFLDQQDLGSAATTLAHLRSREPMATRDLLTWAGAAIERGALDEAEQTIAHAHRIAPGSADVLQAWSDLLHKQGRHALAECRMRDAIAAAPWDAYRISQMAGILRGERRAKEAVDLLRSALRLHRHSATLTLQLARSLIDQGDPGGARDALAEAGQLIGSHDANAMIDEALLHERLGNTAAAKSSALRAASARPARAWILRSAAAMLSRLGDTARSNELLRTATQMEPAHA
jgi:tetratricopeptide (TPR) repeat protein